MAARQKGIEALPLTRHQMKVCARYWVDGLDAEAVGREFGMTTKAVQRVVDRAKKRLRDAGLTVPRKRARKEPVRSLVAMSQLTPVELESI